jgi:uncharacterized protein YegL
MGVMNNQLTEIAFVLDRSGSMQSVAPAAVTGFNDFLRDQLAARGQARLTLVLFDDVQEVPVDNLPLAEVLPLNSDTYVPRGTTALLDAIGETIDRLGRRLEQTPEADRPGKVIVPILTDGLENASSRFTWAQVAAKIKHQTEVYRWDFLFLGANQDAIATAANLHIAAANAATFCADEAGTRGTTRASSRKAVALRVAAAGQELSAAEQYDLRACLSRLVAEEDGKARGEAK